MIRFNLWPLFQGQIRIAKIKVLISHFFVFLEICNFTPTYSKSWAKNILMWSAFTLGSIFKVKRQLNGFGEFSFWWIQFASVLQCDSFFMHVSLDVMYCVLLNMYVKLYSDISKQYPLQNMIHCISFVPFGLSHSLKVIMTKDYQGFINGGLF